ncbi:hypothetical protein BJ912DRAFT_690797 [Pholiota molesta]|nr:hypothetical protein BJ912DRAFT_690797 [Pholiota molesta]
MQNSIRWSRCATIWSVLSPLLCLPMFLVWNSSSFKNTAHSAIVSKTRSKADRNRAQVATALHGFYGLPSPNY